MDIGVPMTLAPHYVVPYLLDDPTLYPGLLIYLSVVYAPILLAFTRVYQVV